MQPGNHAQLICISAVSQIDRKQAQQLARLDLTDLGVAAAFIFPGISSSWHVLNTCLLRKPLGFYSRFKPLARSGYMFAA